MRSFWRLKGVFTTRDLILMAMLVAISAALTPLVIWITPQQKLLSFTLLPLAVGSCLFGPWAAVLMGVAADTVNYLIRPEGPYFPGYALSLAVSCLLYALWQYRKPLSLWRVACAQLCAVVFVHFGLNMLWQGVLLGQTAASFSVAGFYSVVRLVNNAVTFPFMVGLVYAMTGLSAAVIRPYQPEKRAATRVNVLGVGFDNVSLSQAAARALALLDTPGGRYVVTPNSEILVSIRNDREAVRAVTDADLVLPDGVGVVIGSKILKRPIAGRVPGIDFAQALFERAGGKRFFLLGAEEGVAERAAERLGEKYPHIRFCGAHDGFFMDDARIVELIRAAKPDILFVCLGAPKQEKWMLAHRDDFGDCLMVGLGGALNVWAGDLKRAPEAFRKWGMEWFYRLVTQPRRIGRVMTRLPYFLLLVGRQRRSERKGENA